MKTISNELLIEAYHKAKQQGLSSDFIKLIRQELRKRGVVFE